MDNPPENEQINAYLDRLCVWLALLPSEERDEAREEVRQHVVLIADGERERGATPAEAVAAALDKMGDADALGERMYQAGLQRVQKQIEQVTPPHLKDAMRRLRRATNIWSAVAFIMLFALFLWPAFHIDQATWVTFAIMGTVIGAVTSISMDVTRVWMARLLRTLPQRRPLVADVPALPPLPENASPRGKRQYRQQERFLRELGQQRGQMTGLPLRVVIPTQVGSIALVICGTQLTNLASTHHFAVNGLGLATDMAALFASQDIITFVISWSLKRRLA